MRVVARHHHDDVGAGGDPGHGVLAALDEDQLEDLGLGPGDGLGNLHAVGGDTHMATRAHVQQEVTVSVRFEAERLLDDPAAGLVGGGAQQAVLGDREVAAVGGAQGEHPLAPVDQRELRADGVRGQRRQVGAAGEQRRVERALGAAHLVGRASAASGTVRNVPAEVLSSTRSTPSANSTRSAPNRSYRPSSGVERWISVPLYQSSLHSSASRPTTATRAPRGQRQHAVVLAAGRSPARRPPGRARGGPGCRSPRCAACGSWCGSNSPSRKRTDELAADRRVDVRLGQQALLQGAADPVRRSSSRPCRGR